MAVCAKAKKQLISSKIDWDWQNCIIWNICPDCGGRLCSIMGGMGHGTAVACKSCHNGFWQSHGGLHSTYRILETEKPIKFCVNG